MEDRLGKDLVAGRVLDDPPLARFLFGDVRWSGLWLLLRLYVGWQWFQTGWGKLGKAAWTGEKAGSALTGFVKGALAKTTGDHPDVQGWYATFLERVVLPNVGILSYVVVWGEILVGLGLMLGLLTGIAAFFGSFMNMNFLLAGTVSINPVLFVIATWLVLAWKTAGWIGLDRWVLPTLGTPWQPGRLAKPQRVGGIQHPDKT